MPFFIVQDKLERVHIWDKIIGAINSEFHKIALTKSKVVKDYVFLYLSQDNTDRPE
jgi:hypothetical protein